MFGVSLFQKIHAHKLADDLSHLMNMSWHKPDSCNSGTKESTKKHDFWNEGTKKHDLEHGFLARGRAPKSTIFGTRDNNKNHEFVHEGEHQKTRSRARCLDKGEQCTKESTKKHDLEHSFWHEGKHRKDPKSTILCTKENTQNNVRPKYKEILFLTVTAIRTDSKYHQHNRWAIRKQPTKNYQQTKQNKPNQTTTTTTTTTEQQNNRTTEQQQQRQQQQRPRRRPRRRRRRRRRRRQHKQCVYVNR